MPLIKGFYSTNVWNAFLLNALAASIAIVVAVGVKMRFTTYIDEKGTEYRQLGGTFNNSKSILAMFLATFIATFASYTLLHFIFGFGGGLLSR